MAFKNNLVHSENLLHSAFCKTRFKYFLDVNHILQVSSLETGRGNGCPEEYSTQNISMCLSV